MFEVVFFFVDSKSLGESCGEICGAAGLVGVESADSVDAGRRGAAGRLAGTGGGTGVSTSGGGSSVTVGTGGGVVGAGIGVVSSGGGTLTEGGDARTICLLAHPAITAETEHSSARSLNFRTSVSPQLRYWNPEDAKGQAPFDEPMANRYEMPCLVPLQIQIRWNRCATELF